ncbi:MAG: hypothetical protein P4L36_17485 [Holophaga sp.]|nr:hypothetical protein [Holophaga sp.]
MAIWLQVILAIVLVGVGACLVPLLLQLRRTAASVQLLAESAREDIRQISSDVHHLRERADGLADLATASLEFPIGISRIVSGTAQALEGFLAKAGPPWLEALLTGLKFVLNLVRRPKKTAASKEASHE